MKKGFALANYGEMLRNLQVVALPQFQNKSQSNSLQMKISLISAKMKFLNERCNTSDLLLKCQ